MPLPNLPPNLSRTLAREEVYLCLRDWIVQGILQPEETLHDQDIATRLGVSRTPIREALLRLAMDGFVETAHNRWTRVAPLDLRHADELYPIIESLDVYALERSGPNLMNEDLKCLEDANEGLQQALERHDAVAAVAADNAFHHVWIKQVRNRELTAILDQLKLKLRRIELAYFNVEERTQHSLAEHARVIQALRAQQWAEAVVALHQNWQGSLERLHSHHIEPSE
jgi:DNA-binding GntR family transcriptional regulator